ncbi:MAG: long-chain fatty acid--CoA ligase, partial [Rhodospirillales bacterium]|nr:long-chain fatty acid--CoA ligase [Rhodospirillales bacterium]
YPAEIEKVIMTDSRISEAAVIKKQDDKWGEVPVAVVARHDDSLSEEDVVELCLQQLARYKRPKKVLFISADQFPRSTTGKIQRHVLEKQLT